MLAQPRVGDTYAYEGVERTIRAVFDIAFMLDNNVTIWRADA